MPYPCRKGGLPLLLWDLVTRFRDFLGFLFTTQRGHTCLVILFLGNLGVDMFLMGKEQALLFLAVGVPLLVLAMALAPSVGISGVILSIGVYIFLSLWSTTRFFEILSMSGQDFRDKCPKCLIP